MLRALHKLTTDRRSSPLIGASHRETSAERAGLKSDESLEAWRRKLMSAPCTFVSYRIQDGTKAAFDEVQGLVTRGDGVFWDRWCLPQRLVERCKVAADAALDNYLMDSLRASDAVVGIEISGYNVPTSYATKERSVARTSANIGLLIE